MGLLKRFFQVTAGGAVATGASYAWYTRGIKFLPVDVSGATANPDLSRPAFLRTNPFGNKPGIADHSVCVKKIRELRPDLQKAIAESVDNEAAAKVLVDAYAQGVWGGLAFAYQRRYLEKKWRPLGGARDKMIWSREQLQKDAYALGRQLVDHFEVIDRSNSEITFRCGDSPTETATRASDGLWILGVTLPSGTKRADPDAPVTFYVKSLFMNTLEGATGEPPLWLIKAHEEYQRLLQADGVRATLR